MNLAICSWQWSSLIKSSRVIYPGSISHHVLMNSKQLHRTDDTVTSHKNPISVLDHFFDYNKRSHILTLIHAWYFKFDQEPYAVVLNQFTKFAVVSQVKLSHPSCIIDLCNKSLLLFSFTCIPSWKPELSKLVFPLQVKIQSKMYFCHFHSCL